MLGEGQRLPEIKEGWDETRQCSHVKWLEKLGQEAHSLGPPGLGFKWREYVLLAKDRLNGLSKGQGLGPVWGSKILTNADCTRTFSRHPGENRKARRRKASGIPGAQAKTPFSLCLHSGSTQWVNTREPGPT